MEAILETIQVSNHILTANEEGQKQIKSLERRVSIVTTFAWVVLVLASIVFSLFMILIIKAYNEPAYPKELEQTIKDVEYLKSELIRNKQ